MTLIDPAAKNTGRQPLPKMPAAMLPPSIMPMVKPVWRIAMQRLRYLALAYSATVVFRQTTSVPSPMPVTSRSTSSCQILVAKPDSSSVTANDPSALSMIGRRPNRSASGAITKAPIVRPTAATLNTVPSTAGSICHSLVSTGAITPSDTTSNPSATLARQHSTTTAN
jgi:hypothetical protein